MEYISDWITQIIIFILLATMIDLLVPRLTMHKYIKLVIGLILIIILLTPIFMLFQLDVEGQLADSYYSIFNEFDAMDDTKDSMESQKNEIESLHDAYILEEMAVQLKSLVNEDLREEHDAIISELYFTFDDEETMSYESLQEVIVYLQAATNKEGEIQKVDEIKIDTRTDLQEEDNEEIIQLLRDNWELTEKEISVYWEGGTS
ncbi:stage III sporulation protein AF [Oceanobacillus sp. CAU 1775]